MGYSPRLELHPVIGLLHAFEVYKIFWFSISSEGRSYDIMAVKSGTTFFATFNNKDLFGSNQEWNWRSDLQNGFIA
jgi:hypothetical protein